MKVFNFTKHDLWEIPLITESNPFELILDFNSIAQIESLPQTLKKISLSNNKISFINTKAHHPSLLSLNLSFNRIISLLNLSTFPNIQDLNLSNNYIGDDQLQYLSGLQSWNNLNLSNNNLKTDSIDGLIHKLSGLNKLNISNNNIDNLQFTNANENLIQLEIDNNKLMNLSFNVKYPRLKNLSWNGNKLQEIATIDNWTNLEYLSVSENELKYLNITKLSKWKIVQVKSNIVLNFALQEPIESIEVIEFSYNNLTHFSMNGKHDKLKHVLWDNNKLTGLDIVGKGNKYDFIEFIDISYNLFFDISFMVCFNSIQRINLSFNQVKNLKDVLRILGAMNNLKEVNMIENNFNRGLYNVDVVPNEIFNCVEDYFRHEYVQGANKKTLCNYRNSVLKALKNVAYWDVIGVTIEERRVAEKSGKEITGEWGGGSEVGIGNTGNNVHGCKGDALSFKNDVKNRDLNFNGTWNETLVKTSGNVVLSGEMKMKSSLSKGKKRDEKAIISMNAYNKNNVTSSNKTNNNNNNNNNLITCTSDIWYNSGNTFDIKDSAYIPSETHPHGYSNISSTKTGGKTANNPSIIHEKDEVYAILKQTFLNICDKTGYIVFKDFLTLSNELAQWYDISSYISILNSDLKAITKQSLFPDKFHIRDWTRNIKNNKYDNMYNKIYTQLKANVHKSIAIADNQYQTLHPSHGADNINKPQETIKLPSNINYDIWNTRIVKSPLFTTCNINRSTDREHGISWKKSKNMNNMQTNQSLNKISNSKCFNFWFQSNSELHNSPDWSSLNFLNDFIYFINHISFPLKHSEANLSYLIFISKEEKEFKFLKSFLSNFSIADFQLQKWYCYEYYYQVFKDYVSSEFLFENSIMFFYSYYNQIVDNFFNDIYQIEECYLMIEENPLELIRKNLKNKCENKIVMYALVQPKDNDVNLWDDSQSGFVVDNIAYNQQDDKFYFSNPFDWIGMSTTGSRKINKNILVPLYVITIVNI